MKAADLASLIALVLLAGGAVGGYFFWRSEQAKAAERAYEAQIDQMVDRKLEAVGLSFVPVALAAHQGPDRLQALQALYADQEQSNKLNLGFGTARGDLSRNYANFAEQTGHAAIPGRVEAEFDERFGHGAYALMEANYRRFLADAPRIAAERDAQQQRESDEMVRAIEQYRRVHGDLPAGAFRIENGQVIPE